MQTLKKGPAKDDLIRSSLGLDCTEGTCAGNHDLPHGTLFSMRRRGKSPVVPGLVTFSGTPMAVFVVPYT
jgi:hypothetical protein